MAVGEIFYLKMGIARVSLSEIAYQFFYNLDEGGQPDRIHIGT
jgi:hypothetical protein